MLTNEMKAEIDANPVFQKMIELMADGATMEDAHRAAKAHFDTLAMEIAMQSTEGARLITADLRRQVYNTLRA